MRRFTVTLMSRHEDNVTRVVIPAPNKVEARVEALRRSREYGYPFGYFWVYSCREG